MESLEARCMLDGSLAGRVFEDLNGNQHWEPNAPDNESGLECWQVYIDENNNGVKDETEPSRLTAMDGSYRFDGLAPGDYTVDLVQEPGYDRTKPIQFGESTTLISTTPNDHVFSTSGDTLYITSGDRVLRRDAETGETLAGLAVGTSLTGIDITPDGKYLVVGEGQVDLPNSLGTIYKIDLATDAVTTIQYPISLLEGGVFDIAAVSNTKVLFTSSSTVPTKVPLRQLDLTTDTVTARSDFNGGVGIRPNSHLDRNNGRDVALVLEAQEATGPIFVYDPASDSFPSSALLNANLDQAHVSISHDGELFAIEAAGLGLQVFDDSFNVVATPTHFRGGVAFDPLREILYVGDTVDDRLVALNTNTWGELYDVEAGEDLPTSGVYFEMQTSARSKFLSVTTPSGVRYVELDQPVPYEITVVDNQVAQNLDFGNWWNGLNRRPKAVNDSYVVNEDSTLEPSAPGILFNDSDPDGDSITAEIVSSPGNGSFSFLPDGSFVYEPNDNYFGTDQFTYKSRDAALQSCRVATVTLNVLAVNDAPTEITVSGTSVDENAPGAEIGTVEVQDIDVGDQHTIFVSDVKFEVVNNVLKLRSGISLDYELASSIDVTIIATDSGGASASKDVKITINDVNEFSPSVDTDTLDTGEGGTTVGTIQTSDGDSGQQVRIDIVAGNEGGIFSIDPETGTITVVVGNQLDHETTSVYVLTVRATDNGDPERSTTADVTINVTDVNEFAPEMEPATFEIVENTPNGTSVGSVTATDQDTSQQVSYSITGGNTDGAFEINASTGEITVANSEAVDFEANSTFALSVTATDSGSPEQSTTVTVTINVTDVNEFDPKLDPQSLDVTENAPAGTEVGTVVATDQDSAQSLTFEITGGNNGDTFAIDSSTGLITVADSTLLDYESVTQFQLAVSVTDNGSPERSSNGTVTINLLDENEFSPELTDINLDLDETTTTIGSVSATDGDTSQTVLYSIADGNADGIFAIDEQSGEISVAPGKTLDYEQTQQHTLIVAATDNGSPPLSGFATVTVTVRDVNEFSPDVLDDTFTVPENPPNGHSVGTVQASDQDVFQSLTFEITAGNELGAFAIDSLLGHISVQDGSVIDREVVSEFNLTVSVSDNGNPNKSSSATITIVIGDENEFPATIDDQSFSVAENSSNGTVIGTIAVNDADAGSSHTFSILSGNTGGAFAIDSNGQLTVANGSALDFETTQEIQLTVEVHDGAQLDGDTAVITVDLTDQNEFAPALGDHSFQIQENAANGTVVGTVSATDGDTSQSITYAITGGNDSGALAINASTGQITVANSSALDYETRTSLQVTVSATDNGSPTQSDSATVTVDISDSNESAPSVNDQSFQIFEDISNGATVGIVAASDPVDGHSLSFAITGGNTDGAFAIESETGKLTIANASAIDSETRPRYRLTVVVTDDGSPSRSDTATVTVDVSDVNEAPTEIFLDDETVEEHIDGASVGFVVVVDQDINDHHSLSVDDSRFEITTQRELKLKDGQSLDADTEEELFLNITATDDAGNSLTSTFHILVIANDHPWQNPVNIYDVNRDGTISPLDALNVINEINNPRHSDPDGKLPTPRPDDPNTPYYDVNGDGYVTAIDALIIINKLNRDAAASGDGEGEGESGGDGFIYSASSSSGSESGSARSNVSTPMSSISFVSLPERSIHYSPFDDDSSDSLEDLEAALDAFADDVAELWG